MWDGIVFGQSKIVMFFDCPAFQFPDELALRLFRIVDKNMGYSGLSQFGSYSYQFKEVVIVAPFLPKNAFPSTILEPFLSSIKIEQH